MKRSIDTVLFDLDDTLHDDTAAYKRAAQRVADEIGRSHGVDGERVFTAYVELANSYWTKLSSEHLETPITDVRTQMWLDALGAAGIHDRELARAAGESYGRYRAGYLELAPGALELMTELRARGCKLGVVTNGFAATHHDKIDRLGLRPYVDAFFLADEMGLVKPDPAVFVHACRELGSEPARSAMVGDRYDRDVIGAHEGGLFTVLIDVHAIPLPEGAVRPDATVDTIADVLAVLPLGEPRGGPSATLPKRPPT
jgi:putative hydrolase of the HAD superfamily